MRVAVLKCLFDSRPDEIGDFGGKSIIDGFAVSGEDELVFVKVFQFCFGCVGDVGDGIFLISVDPVGATGLSTPFSHGYSEQSE